MTKTGCTSDAVDAAYRDKYGRYPSYVEPMVTARDPDARASITLVRPASQPRAETTTG